MRREYKAQSMILDAILNDTEPGIQHEKTTKARGGRLDSQRAQLVQHLSEQLQQIWFEMDVGVRQALSIWDRLVENSNRISVNSTHTITDLEDDLSYSEEFTLLELTNCSLPSPECLQFGQQLTCLIKIENSILNVIEHYLFCIEQFTNSVSSSSTSPFACSKHAENSSAFQEKYAIENKMEKDTNINNNNNNNHYSGYDNPILQRQLLQDLQVDKHIDRVCQCAQLFSHLRQILLDNEELFEVKVLFQDVAAITGHQSDLTSYANNNVRLIMDGGNGSNGAIASNARAYWMLEKSYNKFQKTMREYERVVYSLSPTDSSL
jgi:hypothetical protein